MARIYPSKNIFRKNNSQRINKLLSPPKACCLVVAVVLPRVVGEMFCTPARAKHFVITISILAVVYNIPHVFEIYARDCLDEDGTASLQICPTSFRQNPLYYTVARFF